MRVSLSDLVGVALAIAVPVGVVVSDRAAGGRNLLNGSGGTGFLGDAFDAPVAGVLATGLALVGGVGIISGQGPGGLFRGMLVGGGAMAAVAWTWNYVRKVEAEKFLAAQKADTAAKLQQLNAEFPGMVKP